MLRLTRMVSILITLPAWGGLFVGLYWTFVDTKVPAEFEVVDQPLVNQDQIIETGGVLQIHRKGCIFSDEKAVISVDFTDGVSYHVPDRLVTMKKGCRDWVAQIDVPHTLNTGRYTYNVTLHFFNNPISHPTLKIQSVGFFLKAHFPLPGYEPPPLKFEFDQ